MQTATLFATIFVGAPGIYSRPFSLFACGVYDVTKVFPIRIVVC